MVLGAEVVAVWFDELQGIRSRGQSNETVIAIVVRCVAGDCAVRAGVASVEFDCDACNACLTAVLHAVRIGVVPDPIAQAGGSLEAEVKTMIILPAGSGGERNPNLIRIAHCGIAIAIIHVCILTFARIQSSWRAARAASRGNGALRLVYKKSTGGVSRNNMQTAIPSSHREIAQTGVAIFEQINAIGVSGGACAHIIVAIAVRIAFQDDCGAIDGGFSRVLHAVSGE